MAPARVRVVIDFDQRLLTLEGVDLPLHLSSVADALPAVLAPLTGWLGTEELQDVGGSVTLRAPPTLVLLLDAGPQAGPPNGRLALARAAGTGGFALALPGSADLGNTPVFGHLLTGIAIGNLHASYLTAPWPSTVPLPKELDWAGFAGAKPGAHLSVDLSSASGTTSVPLVTPETPPTPPPLGASVTADDPSAHSAAPQPDTLQWSDVGITVGPLTIARIGVATGNALMLGVDASLETTVVAIQLTGFVVTIPDGHGGDVHVQLDGLGVDVSASSFTLAGSLVRTEVTEPDGKTGVEYDGSLLLKAGAYALAAVGSYASVDGVDSLFVYGVMAGPFGGPPAFTVTALAAGFGVNRGLVLPAPDKVLQFPLVAAAVAAAGTTAPPTSGAAATQQALSALSKGGVVPIKHGSYWLALGVGFQSYELINGFALLTVSFGDELTIALLGVGTLQLPPPAESSTAFAVVELTLDAVFSPAEGIFALEALLTDRSYLLDPSCRLTGGFATSVWFPPSEHAGDFVVTLGGYHPDFHCDWYPQVPRIGFDWKVSDLVEFSGGLYFALTPRCIMAGGDLALVFHDGPLSAWFKASADMIVYWRPFSYEADLAISIGASYTADWAFLHKTFTVELGADLTLWGPPFAGIAHVHWFVISFTIPIGDAPDTGPSVTLTDWGQFAQQALPAPTAKTAVENICRPRIITGLIASSTATDGSEIWQLCTDRLVLAVETAVPITGSLAVGIEADAGAGTTTTTVDIDTVAVNVAPLGVFPLISSLTVTLLDPAGNSHDLHHGWTWQASHAAVPAALWGPGNTPVDPRRPAVPTSDDMTVTAAAAVTGTAAPAARSGAYTPALSPVDVGDRPLPFPVAPPDVSAAAEAPRPGVPEPEHLREPAREPLRESLTQHERRATWHRRDTVRVGGRPPVVHWRLEEARPAAIASETPLELVAGSSVLHRLAPGRAVTLTTEGAAGLFVAALGPAHEAELALLDPGADHRACPADWLVTTALDPDVPGDRVGWDVARSRLVQVDHHRFVGDGVVVLTQAPVPSAGHGRRAAHRPAHAVLGAGTVLDANRVAGPDGPRSGAVTTVVPPGFGAVAVVAHGDTVPVAVRDGRGDRWLPPHLAERTPDGATAWWYPVDPGGTAAITVAPGPAARLLRVVAVRASAPRQAHGLHPPTSGRPDVSTRVWVA